MRDFLFMKIRCLTSRKAYCSSDSKKTPNEKSNMKKLTNFKYFTNISTDSEGPANIFF